MGDEQAAHQAIPLVVGQIMRLDAGMDLIRNFSQDQFSSALESWDWIEIGEKTPVFTSPFGDVFFRAADGFWWLDTVEATLSRPWGTAEELKATLNTPEGQDRYLLAGLAVSAERHGIVPGPEQVYGYKIAPMLGGQTGLSNVQVIDFVVSINILGQLYRQIRDLPPGTRITGFTYGEDAADNSPR